MGIRCGGEGKEAFFEPVRPGTPPVGVGLRVPRGLAWQRDVVVWGTSLASAIGTLYTVWTMLTLDTIRRRRVVAREKST